MKRQSGFTNNRSFKQAIGIAILLLAILGIFAAGPALQSVVQTAKAQAHTDSTTLYFPRLQMGKEWKTSITLTNNEDREVTSTIKTFNSDGTQKDEIVFGKRVPRWRFRDNLPEQYDASVLSLTQLAAGESKTIDLEALPIDAAAMKVEANGNVIGHVVFQSNDGRKSEAVPAVTELSNELNFPIILDGDSRDKNITIFNPGEYSANAQVIAFDRDGQEIARQWLSPIAPSESRTFALTDLFTDHVVGYVENARVSAGAKLAGIQLLERKDADIIGLFASKSADVSAASSNQPVIKAPWFGKAKITQGNRGTCSHNVCYQRTNPNCQSTSDWNTNCNWENTYALDIQQFNSSGVRVNFDIPAPASGRISFVKTTTSGSGGRQLGLKITGANGAEFEIIFLHLSQIKSGYTAVDTPVRQGDVIAVSGSSSNGSETGTPQHLHMHIWSGQGSRDSHTMPISSLSMKRDGEANFKLYESKGDGDDDASKGSLNDGEISGAYFWSDAGNTSPIYEGYHDRADCNFIEGWAWDRNQPNTPINVDIYDGGTKIMTVPANRFRQDLFNAGKGNGYHGFSVATPASLKDGRSHTIYVKYGGTSNNLNTTGKTITCQSGAKANMTSPASGTTLTSSTVTFYWDAGVGVSEYYLYVGNSLGAYDIYAATQGLGRSRTLSNLPTDGRWLYVRLWSRINDIWQYNDYSYRAYSNATAFKASITSPSNGSTLTSSSVTFYWNSGVGVSQYYLHVGTCLGCANILNQSQGTSLSRTISGIPASGTVYVRLWSLLNSGWQYNDYVYTARR